jgi:Ca2+-binding RTX toxin-like protein
VLQGFGGNNIISDTGNYDVLQGYGGNNTISGAGSHDVLQGFGGNNIISGAGSHDWIDGGPGVNFLTGGTSQTTFAFFAADYNFMDGISNFKPGTPTKHDVLELHSLPGLRNFNQVKHHESIYQGDVAINDNMGDYILLDNIHHKAQLHSYDFHFLA